MKIWQAYFHASVVAFSAWLCRETVFEALQWWNGRPPSDGLLLGSYILLTGVACIPILALHFPHAQVIDNTFLFYFERPVFSKSILDVIISSWSTAILAQ